jgi:hypothetical protein
MKKKSYKKLIIIICAIVLVVGVVLTIGFISEANRQERVLRKVEEYVDGKGFYGKEAGTEYVMTLTFHENTENKLTINFAKENSGSYYLTFKGNYTLYFDGESLMMEVTYSVEELDELVFKKEKFNVKYNKKGEITSLINIDEKGQTSTLKLDE